MQVIGLFFPAIVSVMIRNRKNAESGWRMPTILFRYGIYVLINALLTVCVITYGLGLSGVTVDALNSFPFFTKYTVIALILAILVPFLEEIIGKYIQITLTVRTYDEKREDPVEERK